MGRYFLDDSDVRRIKSGLDKLDFYTKGGVLQRRKRGKLTAGGPAQSTGATFQLIKGVVTDVKDVTIPPTDYFPQEQKFSYCTITDPDGIKSFEEDSKPPVEDPVNVAFEDDDVPAIGDTIWAAYYEAILVIPDHDNDDYVDSTITINWYKIATGKESKIQLVLIDDDIIIDETTDYAAPPATRGVKEDHPATELQITDIILTEAEMQAGVAIVFQDPIPVNDTDYTSNLVEKFNLEGYERIKLNLKYFRKPLQRVLNSGNVQSDYTDTNHLELDTTASDIEDYYVGAIVRITYGTGDGEEYKILGYQAGPKKITIDGMWISQPDGSSTYEITRPEPGYKKDKDKLILATIVIDDPNGGDYGRKVVRYDTIPVWYDDGISFKVGKYTRKDYPNYPENDPWPPPNLPENYFNRKFRGIVVQGVLVTILCKSLPAPILPDPSS